MDKSEINGGKNSGVQVTGNFVEDILDDLGEETIVNFLISALSRFILLSA